MRLNYTLVSVGSEQVCLYFAFYFENTNCKLTTLAIHASGLIDCEGEQYKLEGIKELMERGILRTEIEEKERIYIPEIASFIACDVLPIAKENEVLKEIADIIRELNGKPTTSDLCLTAYQRYLDAPTEENRLQLKSAYEMIPKHLDCWLLGFDEKDVPIRKAIYGEAYREH